MSLATTHGIPLGNGILTVENEDQAIARAAVTGKNKGRDAVEACLEVIRVKRDFATPGPAECVCRSGSLYWFN